MDAEMRRHVVERRRQRWRRRESPHPGPGFCYAPCFESLRLGAPLFELLPTESLIDVESPSVQIIALGHAPLGALPLDRHRHCQWIAWLGGGARGGGSRHPLVLRPGSQEATTCDHWMGRGARGGGSWHPLEPQRAVGISVGRRNQSEYLRRAIF